MNSYSLVKFEVFLAVAELKSITQAAKQLGISKAAVSRDIRALELELAVPLLIRSTRRIDLTDEGQLLAQQCQRLKRELDNTRGLISSMHAQPTGTLRIVTGPYFAETYLMPQLETYLNNFPKVKVDLLQEQRMPDMEKEQVDLVFGVTWPAPLDIVAKRMMTTRYVLCAAPSYLKKYGTPNSLQDLAENHHYIPHVNRSKDQAIVSLKKPKQLHLHTRLRMNDVHFMRDCALRGLGIIELHEYEVRDALERGDLVEILADYLEPKVDVMVYYQKHRYVQPKIRQFLQLVMAGLVIS